ncbi:uncharacterized [Tachysurus ichikawai]
MKAQERCGVCALKLRLLTSERSFNQEQMEERCCVEHVNVLKHKAGITQSYSGTETLPESIHYTDSFFPPPPSSFKAVSSKLALRHTATYRPSAVNTPGFTDTGVTPHRTHKEEFGEEGKCSYLQEVKESAWAERT